MMQLDPSLKLERQVRAERQKWEEEGQIGRSKKTTEQQKIKQTKQQEKFIEKLYVYVGGQALTKKRSYL